MTVISGAPRAPYALEPNVFPFPALATLAGRAPLGGPREIALACFLVARLAGDANPARKVTALAPELVNTRAHAARHWLGSAALPTPVRTALLRLAESTAAGDKGAMHAALEVVMTVTANHLDRAARLELAKLAQAVAE